MSQKLENEYVHSVYSRLATYQNKEHRRSSPRVWPKVLKFVEEQSPGSIVIDVGCGEAKYTCPSVLMIGVDTCADVLIRRNRHSSPGLDLMLADALALPLRDNTADAVLNVSVLHHLSTAKRRKTVVEECGRCLRPGGQMLMYVWSFEQPNGTFPSQDLLVPWNLSETPINGRLPKVKFHRNSTKEQRVIQASIPITVDDEKPAPCSTSWLSSVVNKYLAIRTLLLSTFMKPSTSISPPPAAPLFLPSTKRSLISGVNRWSPMLGHRLNTLLVSVEEQLADEVTQKILHEAFAETMATLREI